MALIECKECHQIISDQAVVCPHCGIPLHIAATTKFNLYIKRKKSDYKADQKVLLYIDDKYIQEMENDKDYTATLGSGRHVLELYCEKKPVCVVTTNILPSTVTTLRYQLNDSGPQVELDNYTDPTTVEKKEPAPKEKFWVEIVFVSILLILALLLAITYSR